MSIRFVFCFLLIPFCFLLAQQGRLNEYGVHVIDNYNEYKQLCESDSNLVLVNLDEVIPGIKKEIFYATTNNFLKEKVYPSESIFLRLPAALALKEIQNELKGRGLGLKIFDAYRPYSITVKMYKVYRDTDYVASAYSGSRHNRGCAVDLTLISLETGEELKMPTEFDDFSEKAHPDYNKLDKEAILNRNLLIEIMQRHGFKVMNTEWWHYDFNNWKEYPLMDISFEELKENLQFN